MAASIAVGLYLLRNVFYAVFAYAGGWLGDRVPRRKAVLAGGYSVALAMAMLLATGISGLRVLIVVFALAGIFTGVVEAIEDSLTAEIVPPSQHGMAYGTLAAVNAVGDFASSLAVGILWIAISPSAAFAAAGILFAAATVLILSLREQRRSAETKS